MTRMGLRVTYAERVDLRRLADALIEKVPKTKEQ